MRPSAKTQLARCPADLTAALAITGDARTAAVVRCTLGALERVGARRTDHRESVPT